MPLKEKQFLSWLDSRLPVIAVIAFSVLGLGMRLALRDVVSGDAAGFLLPWYEQIKENGLSKQVGDYNLLYQFLIFLMTKLPMKPLYAYKLLSVLFDYLLAAGVGLLISKIAQTDRIWKGVLGYGGVMLLPLVALNSAAWAQCDAIYCCFAVFALLALAKDRYAAAMVLLGVSFSFKLQAVFLLPLFLFVYFTRRRFSVFCFAMIPLTMCLTGLPSVLFGRSLTDLFSVYLSQTGTYPYMAMNYPSFWLLLVKAGDSAHYALMKLPAILLTVGVLAMLMLFWIWRKVPAEGENLVRMAFLLSYTCVLFLPAMHERYGYLYEILALVLAVLQPGTLPLCAGLAGVSLCTYGKYLFGTEGFGLEVLAAVNLLLYGAYVLTLGRRMLSSTGQNAARKKLCVSSERP